MNTELHKSFSELKNRCNTSEKRKAYNNLIKTFAEKTKSIDLTEGEVEWLLMALSTCKSAATKNPGTCIDNYQLKGELSSLYKKLFNIASKELRQDSDFGKGDLIKSSCSIFV